MELDTTVTGSPTTPGASFSVDLQVSVPLSEAFLAGVLDALPTLTSITVNRVFVAVPPPTGATGPRLDVEFNPGDVPITSAPGVPISGGVTLSSSTVSGSFTATGSAGSTVDFEIDPAAPGTAAAEAAGGTVWATGGQAAAVELDLTILGVVKVGLNCTDGALTQAAGTDGVIGTSDDVFEPPVTDNPPFLSVPIEAGSTSSTSSSSSSSPSSSSSSTSTSSTSSSSTTSSTTSSSSTSTSTTSTTTTSTTSTVPTKTYLPSGRVEVPYTCIGADDTTKALLAQSGGTSPLDVVLRSDAMESPEKGESFELPLRWTTLLGQELVDTMTEFGITSLKTSNVKLTAGPGEGLSGSDFTATPAPRTITIGSGPASSTEGPFGAPFVRTSEIGDPVNVVAKGISMVTTVDLNGAPIALSLGCSPDEAASLTVTDVEGDVEDDEGQVTDDDTTDSTDDVEVLSAGVAAPSAQSAGLTRTGGSLAATGASVLWWVLLAGVSIDLGYLARSATKPPRRTT